MKPKILIISYYFIPYVNSASIIFSSQVRKLNFDADLTHIKTNRYEAEFEKLINPRTNHIEVNLNQDWLNRI